MLKYMRFSTASGFRGLTLFLTEVYEVMTKEVEIRCELSGRKKRCVAQRRKGKKGKPGINKRVKNCV